ncbi:glucosamine-6-phosphate deaminase [Anaerococcus sp. NML200574]|uniref:Glucosamine-6-phosphate deaminase n=1 Tax=Anaerococcus kampingae TaxID=3115614 RepID=A0ABW9MEL1_9FIRM|nr:MULTISPECIES: glucosamine-6-phosphate deaminase [unclassified Anaerococcus]MCW6678349.1 glucosamine-6-phosphate deaminase [Anaerococcus sp. NML200574]
MKVIVCKDYDDMSKKASELVISNMIEKPQIKFGFATGSSPIGLYKNLIAAQKEGEISFKYAKSVNLDEYVGIDKANEQSYSYFMDENLFDHVNINKENTHLPYAPENDEKYAIEYRKILDDFGQRDIQILGLGPNGHIAFNEPADKLNRRASIIKLTDSTIEANSRFFENEDEVPKYALSMGVEEVFDAKTLIVLASGKSKHEAVKRLLNDDTISTELPCSLLNLHPNVYLFVDEEAYNG